jgi:Ureidoglycolate hydrolase
MNIFVCAARVPLPPTAEGPPSEFHVSILERHPYTTQTFTPLTADPSARYLVIVAPTLPPDSPGAANLSSDGPDAEPSPALPTPASIPSGASYPRPLPGPGMPDLKQMRAYVATASQAVTYGAGTWHAPMVALGMEGTAVDFVVSQFANGVVVEDCQEVVFGPGVTVKVPPSAVSGKREARAFKL